MLAGWTGANIVTWLPMTVDGASERDAVLGLHPQAYASHKAFLATCAAAIEPQLLELSRARMAQMLRCREELARHSADTLAMLTTWYRSPALTPLQRHALAFVEQFIIDPSLVSREQVAELEGELGATGVINFATVISGYEASLRLSALLDLEPAP